MNETINAIRNRRSVRNYLYKQIREDELNLILDAGLHAPSAHNQQSWHFTVVQNRQIINDLNIAAKEAMLKLQDESLMKYAADKDFNIFYNAPSIIVISGEKSAILPTIDCAAATQNMIIAAESLNIGSCWIGLVSYLFRSKEVEKYIKLLQIPQGYEPYYAITLGYKAQPNQEAPPRRAKPVNFIRG